MLRGPLWVGGYLLVSSWVFPYARTPGTDLWVGSVEKQKDEAGTWHGLWGKGHCSST